MQQKLRTFGIRG